MSRYDESDHVRGGGKEGRKKGVQSIFILEYLKCRGKEGFRVCSFSSISSAEVKEGFPKDYAFSGISSVEEKRDSASLFILEYLRCREHEGFREFIHSRVSRV